MRIRLVIALVILTAACGNQSTPAPTEKPPAENARQTPVPERGAMGQRPDFWQRRDLDWSILEKSPFSTQLGTWDESVAAEKVCLDGRTPERCLLMLRALARVGNASEIRDVMQQVDKALPVLTRVWADEFARLGRTFVAPTVWYYGVDWQDVDGVLPPDRVTGLRDCEKPFENAVYCPLTHTIYLDAIYFARVAAAVRDIDHTSGRFAALAVAAHELGHAVHMQTGDASGDRPAQELLADCFAGAATAALRRAETGVGYSKAARLLYTENALIEGQLGIAIIQGPVAKGDYQSGPIRADFFTRGFNRGFGSCAARFKNPLD